MLSCFQSIVWFLRLVLHGVCERHCIEAELFPFNTVDDLCGVTPCFVWWSYIVSQNF